MEHGELEPLPTRADDGPLAAGGATPGPATVRGFHTGRGFQPTQRGRMAEILACKRIQLTIHNDLAGGSVAVTGVNVHADKYRGLLHILLEHGWDGVRASDEREEQEERRLHRLFCSALGRER